MGKVKLIWPTVAEELQTSAVRRRTQRDREQRTNSRISNRTATPDENRKPMEEVTTKHRARTPKPKLKQQTLNRFFGKKNGAAAPAPVVPFIELSPVFEEQPNLAQHFGRALALTQFIHSHGKFLNAKNPCYIRRLSAEKLLFSMTDGSAGYSECVLSMLRLFTDFLIDLHNVNMAPPKSPDLPVVHSLRSRAIRKSMRRAKDEEPNLLEIVKKLFIHFQLFDVCAAELADANLHFFHQLSVDAQLTILEHFVDKVYMADMFSAYIKDQCMDQLRDARKHKTALEQTLIENRAQLAQLENKVPNNIGQIDLCPLTRKQSAEHSAYLKQISKLTFDISCTGQELDKAEKQCRILKINNGCRVEPLGHDRFHRLYWFFAGSADDHAVFVQRCNSSSNIGDEENNDGIPCITLTQNDNNANIGGESKSPPRHHTKSAAAGEGEKGGCCSKTVVMSSSSSAAVPSTTERWWCIRDSAKLAMLMDMLLVDTMTARGQREHRLKMQLIAYRDLIEQGMH